MNGGWLVLAAAVTALAALGGAFLGFDRARRADDRLDRWRRREETMRMIRWATDKALDPAAHVAAAGVAALEALLDAELLQPEDEDFVESIAATVASDGMGAAAYDDELVAQVGEDDE